MAASSSWQGSHYIVVLGASALAFAAGYVVGGRSDPPDSSSGPAFNTSNTQAPIGNMQAPRPRPDENELIERNAEPEEGLQPQPREPANASRDDARDIPPARGGGGDRAGPAKPPADRSEEETFGTDDE